MEKRNVLLHVFLMIITFGIYNLYWFYKTNKELKKLDSSAPNPNVILYILGVGVFFWVVPFALMSRFPFLLVFIFPLYFLLLGVGVWSIVYYVKYARTAVSAVPQVDGFTVVILSLFFCIAIPPYLQSQYNQFVPKKDPLHDYVKQVKAQGFSDEQIRKALLKQGYSDDAINDVFLGR